MKFMVMNWHEFVFSEKKSYQITRHVIFWLVWGAYFFLSMSFLPRQTNAPYGPGYSIWNLPQLLHGLLILGIHMLACYAFIYFIVPRNLLRARYISFLLSTICLGLVMVVSTRFVDTIVFPFIDGVVDSGAIPFYNSVFSGLVSAIKIIAFAAAIKLVKYWWMKQKEKERLEKEKIEAELQLLKAEIHPSFLFSTLKNISSYSSKASSRAPEMLLKLSDILSYMLYDCSDREVIVEKEIKMIKDYMSLEKIRFGENLEMNIQVKGPMNADKIAPLLLLHFIENSFSQCDDRMTVQPWINLEIEIENHVLHMKLMNGKSSIKNGGTDENVDLIQAKRRLEFLYANNHELVLLEEPEIMMVNLKLKLIPSLAIGNGTVLENKERIESTA